MFSSFFMFALSLLSIVWTLPLLVGRILNLQLFKISNSQHVVLVMKKLPKRGSIMTDDNPKGWVCGWPYIGYIHETSGYGQFGPTTTIEIYLFTTKEFYQMVTTHVHNQKKDDIVTENITMWERSGSFFRLEYSKRKLDVSKYMARHNQAGAVEEINERFNAQNHVVAFIYGSPGAGKSMIPVLLAKKLKGSLCITFDPTDPGDSIALVYNSICPGPDNPLILVFEEVDTMINKIHRNGVADHKSVPIQIKNKTSFNTFFDWIDRGLYPYMILILTSNSLPDKIESLDPSYIRPGRVDLRIHIKHDA